MSRSLDFYLKTDLKSYFILGHPSLKIVLLSIVLLSENKPDPVHPPVTKLHK
jgi:hypothetical protein